MSSVDARLDRIEGLLGDLIYTVGLLKSQFEDEKEKNEKRFEKIDSRFDQIDRRFGQVDRRFEQIEQRIDRMESRMDRRFDDFMPELGKNRQEHEYMASRLFRAEMELDQLKRQMAGVKDE